MVWSVDAPPAEARTVTVATGRLRGWLAGFVERHGAILTDESPDVVRLTGSDGARAWLEVPFPPLEGDLAEHVERDRRVGVLLVRRGGYAAGVFEAGRLVTSKVGSAYVQGTTKAGGSSQQRYARRRANQATAAFAEAADVAARVLADETLDAIVTGGDRPAVRAVLADSRLKHLERLVTAPWLAVKDPRLRVLTATPEQFLAVRIRLDP
jgi:hypothetical protein